MQDATIAATTVVASAADAVPREQEARELREKEVVNNVNAEES